MDKLTEDVREAHPGVYYMQMIYYWLQGVGRNWKENLRDGDMLWRAEG